MGTSTTMHYWVAAMAANSALAILAATHGLCASTAADERAVAGLVFVFVVVCALRAALPRIDNTRVCLVDTPMSTPLVGRSAATVAELCFVVLVVTCIARIAKASGGDASAAGAVAIGIIVLAEVLSWIGCLVDDERWNAAEETLWMVCGAMLAGGAFALARRDRMPEPIRRFLYATAAGGAVYVAFMAFVDIPMYVAKWRERRQQGRQQPQQQQHRHAATTLLERLRRMNRCEVVTSDMATWRDELPWFTAYFGLGPWVAVAMGAIYRSPHLRN